MNKKYTKEQIIHTAKCCEISLIDAVYLCRRLDDCIKYKTVAEYLENPFKY